MKKHLFLLLLPLLALAGPARAEHAELGGVFYVCTNDLEQERRFLGIDRGMMEDEAKRLANQSCDNLSGGVAVQVVYVYKDGSQRSGN